MSDIHILTDPSGAYLCLDYSLVCSHLESLLTRIRVSLERGDRVVRCADRRLWDAFEQGEPEASPAPTVTVRKTKLNLIMGRDS